MAQYPEDELLDEEQEQPLELDPEQEEELRKQAEQEDQLRMAKLNELGQALMRTRKLAIEGRQALGIEQAWMEDQDAYEGIDDANRTTETGHGNRRWRKGASTSDRPTVQKGDENRSTALLNITRPYTDAGTARLSDMILPMDDRPWMLKPTPVPELVKEMENPQPLPVPGLVNGPPPTGLPPDEEPMGAMQIPPAPPMGGPAGAAAVPEQATPPGLLPPEEPQGPPQTTADLAKSEMDKATKAAEKAQTRIDDWLVETQWHSEARKQIDDSGRLGTGILKGPYPVRRKQTVWGKDEQGNPTLLINEEIKPASSVVSCWNCYPDPQCGENIHNGAFHWERDDITPKALRDLKGTPGAIDAQIDECLKEGALRPEVESSTRGGADRTPTEETLYEIWYYHGNLEREDLEAAGCDCADEKQDIVIPVVMTIVNDRVVRAALNPLDTGRFPYDYMVWQKRAGMPWGAGIPRQLRTPQRMVTAANRAMLENGGLSSGPQIVVMRDVVEPADGQWALTPRKFWWGKSGATVQDLRAAFLSINIDCKQAELLEIINFALKMAEEVTGMPALLQGQQGNAPDILGVVQILNNNASAVSRRLARTFDYQVIEPHITRYYEWLLLYGENEEEKGLFIVDAQASTVLVERDIQKQIFAQIVPMAVPGNPYKIDPAKFFEEFAKGNRIDPRRIQYTDEEWKRVQENMAKAPPDPRVQVAEMNAQAKAEQQQKEHDFKASEAAQDRKLEALLASVDGELSEMDIRGKKEISLEEVKAMLARVAITERNKAQMLATEAQLRRTTGAGI